MSAASALPWVEKYRPRQISDVLGHEDVVRTLQAFLEKGQLPHILLHGPPGTGKTSVVQAVVRAICGGTEDYRVLELNASDERGIQTVRERIKVFADAALVKNTGDSAEYKAGRESESVAPAAPAKPAQQNLMSFFGKAAPAEPPAPAPPKKKKEVLPKQEVKAEPMADLEQCVVSPELSHIKLIVLDEVDQMTAVAQTALRRIMERHASHVRFFLMCNDVNKINLPIQSRCCKFHFSPVSAEFMRTKLEHVIAQEKVLISPAAVDELITLSNGDFRRLLNTLQACAMSKQQNVSVIPPTAAPRADCMTDTTDESTAPCPSESKEITADIIRHSLGLPDLTQVNELIASLEQKPFQESFALLTRLLTTKGYSLSDLVDSCYVHLIQSDMTDKQALTILPRLGEIKNALAVGASSLIQAGCLIAAFVELKMS